MARIVEKLSATGLNSKGPGLHADGRGLYLQVKDGGRSWIFRYMLAGKARYMGLGPFSDISLADARREADAARQLLRQGTDPIEARRQRLQAARLDAAKSVTSKEAATRYIDMHSAGWKNAKHRNQWSSTLETYAFPVFGSLPVQAIDTTLVMKVLEPIWRAKTSDASSWRHGLSSALPARGLLAATRCGPKRALITTGPLVDRGFAN